MAEDAAIVSHHHAQSWDTAWVFDDHADCDVCLMVAQDGTRSRHALMRMDAEEAAILGHALLKAAGEPNGGSFQRIRRKLGSLATRDRRNTDG